MDGRRYHILSSVLTRITLLVILSAALYLLFGSQPQSQAQSSCVAYNQCAALQTVSTNKVQGPIKYWFDNDHIDSLLSPEAANDFRNRLKAAATDWATQTGSSSQKELLGKSELG